MFDRRGNVRHDVILGAIHFPQDPNLARNAEIESISLLTFTKLQFVKDGGFTCGIKTNHEDSHLLLAELYCNESAKSRSILTGESVDLFLLVL